MKKFLIPLIPLLLALSCTPAKDSFSYQNFYGFGEVEPFGQIVLSGQSVRMSTSMKALANLRGAIRMSIRFKIEIKETGKTALEGTATFVYFFKK